MPPEGRRPSGLGPRRAALTVRPRALGASEPRQVRKEAALRIASQVPRTPLTRAKRLGSSRGVRLDGGCATGPLAPNKCNAPAVAGQPMPGLWHLLLERPAHVPWRGPAVLYSAG